MAGLVMLLDRYGRPLGQLPTTLAPVLEQFSYGSGRDMWSRPIRYVPDRRRYELRSAGRDGVFQTADDIVFTGRLGRNRPCEVRDEYGRLTYPGIPPCSPDEQVVLLPLCPELRRQPFDEHPVGVRDRVMLTGRTVVRIARRTDGLAREVGGMLPDLSQVTGPDFLKDSWGRSVRYRSQGETFEVRSAGRDGAFDDGDDVVVRARLAHAIPCEFTGPDGTTTCADPTPPCPEAGG
jgi:hypothetical protein